MIRLYGSPRTRVNRVMWLLEEMGIEYELRDVFEKPGDPPTEEIRSLNPNAKVPVLVSGDFVMWESLAINHYLARKYGSPLWPTSEVDRARALQWSFWVVTEVEPFLWEMWQHRERLPLAERDTSRANQAESMLHAALETFENHLASHDWVVGPEFSVADLNLESYIIRARHGGYNLALHPHVYGWI